MFITFKSLQPPARIIAAISYPIVRRSCAAPTRSEWPDTSLSRGRSPRVLITARRNLMEIHKREINAAYRRRRQEVALLIELQDRRRARVVPDAEVIEEA